MVRRKREVVADSIANEHSRVHRGVRPNTMVNAAAEVSPRSDRLAVMSTTMVIVVTWLHVQVIAVSIN